jgi:tetratricopeptide (TPR) repeat protein
MAWWWHRSPLAAFGIGWFLLSVIPVLDLVPLSFREMGLADRYLYLPSVGLSLLLALGITRLMGSAVAGAWGPRRVAGWGAILLVLTLYPWSVLRYGPVWRNNFTLYTRMEQVAPHSPNPPLNLGLAYFRANNLTQAKLALERAVRLNPRLQRPRSILALLYVLEGRRSHGFQIFDALASEGASERDYYLARTQAHLFVGEPREAVTVAEDGARRFPGDADLAGWLGRALERAGRPTEAIEEYYQALTLRPDLYQVEEALGNLLARSGRPDEAAQHFLRSAALRPDRAQPLRALALLLEVQGNRTESLRLWRQVLQLAPNGAALREAAANIRRLELGDTGSRMAPQAPRSLEKKGS